MKQCPKCNSSCENNVIICDTCGYLFAPAGFEEQITSALNQKGYVAPQNNIPQQNNFGEPFNPQIPYYQEPHNNSLSIAALVLGIVGVVAACCYGIGSILGILSLIFGIISRKKIMRLNGLEKGKGFALAGIILGAVSIAIAVAWIIVFVYAFANNSQLSEIFQHAMQTYNSSNG